MKLTKQRLSLFSVLPPHTALTLREIMTAMGMRSQVSRGDYIRVHQFIMGFVKLGLITQNKVPRHGESTFTLSVEGAKVADALHQAYEEKVRKVLAWKPRAFPQRNVSIPALVEDSAMGHAQSERIIPPLRCPNCGMTTLVAEAQAMIRAGQKVRCQCNYNLTAIAWAAMEGR